jgi:hypothetical protein
MYHGSARMQFARRHLRLSLPVIGEPGADSHGGILQFAIATA